MYFYVFIQLFSTKQVGSGSGHKDPAPTGSGFATLLPMYTYQHIYIRFINEKEWTEQKLRNFV
jgi:hypothetical protein